MIIMVSNDKKIKINFILFLMTKFDVQRPF